MASPTLTVLGVDIGGTFTDFALVSDGKLALHKRLTTPDDPARALLEGVEHLNLPIDAVIVHGSTIATNALLERKGARTAFIATRGFADIIEIGRQNRPDLYALVPVKPPSLIPFELRFEVDERVAADGSILAPLDPATLPALIDQLRAANVESVAVCLLFSFLAPQHEQMIGAALKPYFPVSLSSDILPEYREYERASATVINAYVSPLMGRYLDRLEQSLGGRHLHIMQSNGGVISAATARHEAARTALSGPAGGAVGAFQAAKQAGYNRIITFDMGGTSTDVALLPGSIQRTREAMIGGMPLRLPVIDIHTIGAGGGSIARVDAGGALQVGPRSAGADPGPACYGRGDWPTVTDANLVLGRLHPDHFLGGEMRLDEARAQAALNKLAEKMGASSPQAALGVVQVANAAMERAIRAVSVERGHDPRDFALVAFGGAGPLHACALAEALQIPQVIVPRAPGVLSALGMAFSDWVKDYTRAIFADEAMLNAPALDTIFAALEARAHDELRAEGVSAENIRLARGLDMRYTGQSHEIQVEAANGDWIKAFHAAHEQRYGYRQPDATVEAVSARLRATGLTPKPEFAPIEISGSDPAQARLGSGGVWLSAAERVEAAYYDRDRLAAGNEVPGPAILFQLDATAFIPPGWMAKVDQWGHLVINQ